MNGQPRQLSGADTDNWNHTTRIGYDQTITPTLLFHIGLGYFQTRQPNLAPPFDQSTIGLKGYQANQIFPDIAGVSSLTQGGYTGALGATFSAVAYEQKPTATTSLTWVHANHTFKAGGEVYGRRLSNAESMARERQLWLRQRPGPPIRINSNLTNSAGQTLNIANPTGFSYASFLTGLPNTLNLNAPNSAKLGITPWVSMCRTPGKSAANSLWIMDCATTTRPT